MWTRQLLKDNAKIAFKRNYWSCVAVCILAGLFSFTFSLNLDTKNLQEVIMAEGKNMTFQDFIALFDAETIRTLLVSFSVSVTLTTIVAIWFSNVAAVGRIRYFLENREHLTKILQVFYGFQGERYLEIVKIMALRMLYIFGWGLLFLVPGIIKAYSYLLVPYILAENPDLDKKRVFKLSAQMMAGYKMEAFVLGLSFWGWGILGFLTGNILTIFYVHPYINATYAEFYSAVKANAMIMGIVTLEELPGVLLPEE